MKVLSDIKNIRLVKLLGLIAFGLVVYLILTGAEIGYVQQAMWLFAGVWGSTSAKNIFGIKTSESK